MFISVEIQTDILALELGGIIIYTVNMEIHQ